MRGDLPSPPIARGAADLATRASGFQTREDGFESCALVS